MFKLCAFYFAMVAVDRIIPRGYLGAGIASCGPLVRLSPMSRRRRSNGWALTEDDTFERLRMMFGVYDVRVCKTPVEGIHGSAAVTHGFFNLGQYKY